MFLLSGPAARAQSKVTLTGQWSASALDERWNIGDWGSACGPRPVAQTIAGGPVAVAEQGDELSFSLPGRVFRTSECWEQMPGLTRRAHSVAPRSWRTECGTKPTDSRQARIVTQITAADTTIVLDEVGEYQFVIERQNCTASVRRSRTFALIARAGATAAASAAQGTTTAALPAGSSPPSAGVIVPAPPVRPDERSASDVASLCTRPGDPARIEVRPSRKLLRPGEKFSFRAQVFDENGCVLSARPTFVVATPGAKASIVGPGTVLVGSDADDGEVSLDASLGGRAARVTIEIVNPARYDALLAGGGPDGGFERDEPAVALVATGNIGSGSAVAPDTAAARKTAFVAIVGSLAILLAGTGVLLLKRANARSARRAAAATGARELAYPGLMPSPASRVVPPAPPAIGETAPLLVCPSCRAELPATSGFCPYDGNRLVAAPPRGSVAATQPAGGICPICGRGFDPGVAACPTHGEPLVPATPYRAQPPRAAAPTDRGKICPSCGGRYTGEAAFCGRDGTSLVHVN